MWPALRAAAGRGSGIGYDFRERTADGRRGLLRSFSAAASAKALERTGGVVRSRRLHRVRVEARNLAEAVNPTVAGLMSYDGAYDRSAPYPSRHRRESSEPGGGGARDKSVGRGARSTELEGEGVRGSEEFDEFYLGSLRRVSGYVYALTGDRAETEDLVQEAYSRAWQNWERACRHADPEAWVRTVAYRLRVSRWRRVTAGVRALRRHGGPGEVPEVSVDYVAIITALRAIPFQQRRAVVLHYLVGLSMQEIARETDVAVGTVKSRVARGREALAGLLGDGADHRTRPYALIKEANVHA